MSWIIPQMIGTAGQYENAFPSHPVDMWAINNGIAYANSITPTELINYFYPTAGASDHAALVQALTEGSIQSTDFLTGWLDIAAENPTPSAADVLAAVFDAGLGTPALPTIDLGFAGVTDTQTAFLIGVYVAAFDRAPEHAGLAYWAGDLARLLADGMAEPDAMKHMAKAMYVAGAEHGEQGTDLTHADYVRFVYATVLDREPDSGGEHYWTNQLQAGADRSELIAVFLTSALQAAGDGDYVKARIAVAEYAAQAHVSGPGATVDLAGVLDDVANAGDAYLAIQALALAYPGPSNAHAEADAITLPSALFRWHDSTDDSASVPPALVTPDDVYAPEVPLASDAYGGIHLVGWVDSSADML